MKRISLLLTTLIVVSFYSVAQIVQKGVVQEYNERLNKTPLAGVELNVRSAQSTVSNKDGTFSLQFLTLKPGARITVRRIEKIGYEIFNKEALEQWNLNPSAPFTIVMCRSDRFKRIRDNYMKVSSKSYALQLKKEEAALAKLKSDGKIKETEYYQRLKEIRENYERQLDNLDNYIDHFSRIDLSKISRIEQDIISLVEQGNIEQAIKKYEELNLVDKLKSSIRKRKEVQSAIIQLSAIANNLNLDNDSLYYMCERWIQTLKLEGRAENNQKIAEILTTVADADTTNTEWLNKTGIFLNKYMSDFDGALRYLNISLRNNIEKYGSNHTDVATSYNNIGTVLYSKGNYPKSLEITLKALEIFSNISENHPSIAKCYNNIGNIYSAQKKYAESLAYYTKSLIISLNTFGDNDIEVAKCYNNIGNVLYYQKHYSEALQNYYKSLSINLKNFGENNPNLALDYNNIGNILYSQRNYSEAIENYNKSISIIVNTLNDAHPLLAGCFFNLGHILQEQGNYPEALDNYNKALSIRLSTLGENHPDVADCYYNIGIVLDSQENYPEALENYNASLIIKIKNFGENHPDVADCYYNIGIVLHAQGNYHEALSKYNKSLSIQLNLSGEKNPKVAHCYYSLGLVYRSLAEYSKALKNINKAIEICPEDIGLYGIKSRLLCDLGEKDEAKKLLDSLPEIFPDVEITDLPSYDFIYE